MADNNNNDNNNNESFKEWESRMVKITNEKSFMTREEIEALKNK